MMDSSKRKSLKYIWIVLGGAAFVELLFLVFSFFWPFKRRAPETKGSSVIKAGHADAFDPGSVTAFITGQFYLYRHGDGGFLALSARCTHLGCALPWNKEEKKFICPCHASRFDITGNVLASPAPRAMDIFKINIVNKEILVDTGTRIRRNRFNKEQLVYPRTVISSPGKKM